MADNTKDFFTPFDPATLAPGSPTQLPPNSDDFFEPFDADGVTGKQKERAFEQGLNAGLSHGAPTAVGIGAGARIGAKAGSVRGPVGALFGGIGGAITGMVAGDMAGQGVQNQLSKVQMPDGTFLTYESMNAVPLELRPFAKAGEVAGSSIPLGGLPLYAAAYGRQLSVPALTAKMDDLAWWSSPYVITREGTKKAVNLLPRYINTVINSAGRHPISFLMAEAQAGLMGGVGAGVAEASFPGSAKAEFIGSTIGGFFNWGRWVGTAVKTVGHNAAALLRGSSTTEERAAKYLQTIVGNSGTSIDDTIIALQSAGFDTTGLTSGLKSGNPALLALEAGLAKQNQRFGVDASEAGQRHLWQLKTMIVGLREIGSPEALKVAAQAEDALFTANVNARFRLAADKLTEATAHINPNLIDAKSFTEFGKNANRILDEALTEVRAVEKSLWDAVPQGTTAKHDNFAQAVIDTRTQRILPNQKLDPDIEGYLKHIDAREQTLSKIRKLEAQGKPVPAGMMKQVRELGEANFKELRILRSELLNMVRKYSAASDWNSANLYSYLAAAVDKDLASAISGDLKGQIALDTARTWSKQMHDAFTRTFVGDIQGAARDGAQAVAPELVMSRVFASGKELGALQFQQLREASRFAGQEYFARMAKMQYDTLQYAASKVIDPATGKVNGNALAKFRRDNHDLIAQFPDLQTQLSDVSRANDFFAKTQSAAKNAKEEIRGNAAFSMVLKHGDAAEAIGAALSSPDPLAAMRQFKIWSMDTAKLPHGFTGEDVAKGLESAVFHHALAKAGGAGKGFSFTSYHDAFFAPLSASGPSMADTLVKSGVLKQGQINQLKAWLGEAARIETAIASKQSIEQFRQRHGPIVDFVLRYTGSKLGAFASGGSNSLIIQGAGSNMLRQVFDSIPRGKMQQVILQASRDPELMVALLQKATTPKEQLRVGLQMNAFLYANALGGWESENGQYGQE
jgi:hypothetical protein